MIEYIPIAPLGKGGMAQVELVLRCGLGAPRPVALKRARVDQDDAERSETEKTLVAEALIAAKLVHPNIVTVIDLGTWNGQTVVELEYVEGASLGQLLRHADARGTKVPDDVILRIMSDVLAALHHAHEVRGKSGRSSPIIHRDVSPSNIIVGLDGHTRLIDFGVAKAPTLSTETPAGIIKGKLRYMAPEQLRGEAVDPRADLFSCGVVLWEALTRKNLHTASCAYSLVMGGTAPRISSKVQVSKQIDDVVASCLERWPDRRFPSALALQAALRECARDHCGFASSATLSSVVREVQGEKIQRCREAIQEQLDLLGASEARTSDRHRAQGAALVIGATLSALAGAALSLLR